MKKELKILTIADLHGHLPTVPKEGEWDFFFLCGDIAPHFDENWDFSNMLFRKVDREAEAKSQKKWLQGDFMGWWNSINAKHKIIMNGNHDFWDGEDLFENYLRTGSKTMSIDGVNIGLLCGSNFLKGEWFDEIEDVEFMNRAYNLNPKIDILATHQPPSMIMDRAINGDRIGSGFLYRSIFGSSFGGDPFFDNLKLHVFGHVHENNGVKEETVGERKIVFVNSSKNFRSVKIEIKGE